MMKKRRWIAVVCALLAALTLLPACAVGAGQSPARVTTVIQDAEEHTSLPAFAVGAGQNPTHVTMVVQDAGEHTPYMEGSNGQFNPERPVSRAELAQLLARVVADEPAGTPQFYDVPADAWYAPAAAKAAGLGLMEGGDGLFRPTEPATRAECAFALALLLPDGALEDFPFSDFPDVQPGYWAYDAIVRTAFYGLFNGDAEGNFRPESSLKRCEVAAVFNRLMGREPDRQYIAGLGRFSFFSDVSSSHWAYWDIVEATISHSCTANLSGVESWAAADVRLPDGPQRIDGRLYWVVDGEFAKNQSIGYLQFDEYGRYTTGDADLDTLLNDIVEQQTNDSMTQDQKLRALFDYVVKNYRYLARPMVAKGTAGWEPEYALYFLQNGKGNCFSFAATYCLLCQELGLPAYTWVGAYGRATSPHSWVEIPLDGATYMFDPELQWYYNNRTSRKVNLFKVVPSRIPASISYYFW